MHTLLQRIYKKNIAFFVRFVNYFFFKEFIPLHLTVWALFVKARLEWPAGHDKRKYKKYFSAINGQSKRIGHFQSAIPSSFSLAMSRSIRAMRLKGVIR